MLDSTFVSFFDHLPPTVNLEFKFKLNFDEEQEGESKIEKKVKIQKKNRVKI